MFMFKLRPPPTQSSRFKGDLRIYQYKEWKRKATEDVRYQLKKTTGYYDCIEGSVRVHITAFPKDRRFRGLDKYYTAALDIMLEVNLIGNDSQVASLFISRLAPPTDKTLPTPPMMVTVTRSPVAVPGSSEVPVL